MPRINARDVTYVMLAGKYHLDDSGRIFSKDLGRQIAEIRGPSGYKLCGLNFGPLGKCNSFIYHRAVVMLHLGRDLLPGEQVNHINKNKADNHPDNLEVLTAASHVPKDQGGFRQSNSPKTSIPNVNWRQDRGRWEVNFSVGGKSKFYGYFTDFIEACCRRNVIAQDLGYRIASESDIQKALTNQGDNYATPP